jgi:hypothetical protein
MTKTDPQMSHRHPNEDRAWCSLCKGGGSGYDPGFRLPDGLQHHLSEMRSPRCPVISAAFKNAKYSLRDSLEAERQAEKENKTTGEGRSDYS